jgi:hypothetical protein
MLRPRTHHFNLIKASFNCPRVGQVIEKLYQTARPRF